MFCNTPLIKSALILFASTGLLQSQINVTWLGDADSEAAVWSDENLWSGESLPGVLDTVLLTQGTTVGSSMTLDGSTNRTVAAVFSNLATSGGFSINAGSGSTLTVTGSITQSGSVQPLTINAPLVGTEQITLIGDGNGGRNIVLGGDNSGFSGGFSLEKTGPATGTGRYFTTTSSGANSLGSGITTVNDYARLLYSTGALANDGQVNVAAWGMLDLANTPSSSRDRFSVASNGALLAAGNELAGLTRVTEITGGQQVILASGAIVGSNNFNNSTIANGGTQADLLFGLRNNVTQAAQTLNAGADTPWGGLSATPISAGNAGGRDVVSLNNATININTQGFNEFILQGHQSGTRITYLRLLGGEFKLAGDSTETIDLRIRGGVIFGGPPNLEAFQRIIISSGAQTFVTTAAATFSDLSVHVEASGVFTIEGNNPANTPSIAGLTGNGSVVIDNAAQRLLISDTASPSTFSGTISGAGQVERNGTGIQIFNSANTYTGGTSIANGTLLVNNTTGSATGTGAVSIGASGILGGSGLITGVVQGEGLVAPGNSPGILTVGQIDGTGGLNFAFEFTQEGLPQWSNAHASGNDVLRITHATSPFASALDEENVISIYINSLGTFTGGFFTNRNADFTSLIADATFAFFIADDSGDVIYNSIAYSALVSGVDWEIIQIGLADFASGSIEDGWAMQVTAIPEPSTWLLLGMVSLAGVLIRRRWMTASRHRS